MADIKKIKDKITSTIYPNGKGAINATDHQAMLLEMADGMAETDSNLSTLSEELESKADKAETNTKLSTLSEELESKADKSDVSIPDWDASEDEAGYINNRTHYKEAVERTFVGIEKGDYILDAEGNPDGWESWVEAGGVEDEGAKVSLPVTISFGLESRNFNLTFDHVGQREILEIEEYENSYVSILEVRIDEKEGECYLHFTTRGCFSPWLIDGQEIDVRIESFKRLNDGYIPSTIARKSDLEGLSEEIDSQSQLIEDLQNTKIDKEADDYYPQLSVGVADNLAGVEVVSSEFTTRQSGGGAITDGVARVQSIKGNSVVWNQLAKSPLFDNSEESWFYNSDFVSATLLDNGEIYAKGKGVYMLGYEYISPRVPLVSGHAYLYRFDIKKNISEAIGVYLGDVWNNPTLGKPIDADIWYHMENISIPTENLECGLWIYPWNNTTLTDCEAWIKNVVVYDLTKMFGEGNEPSTIEEFYQRIPMGVDLHAYNEGEVISMNVDGIKSVGVNAWDEQWESGTIAGQDGILVNDATKIRTSNLIRVLPNKEYHFTQPSQLPIRVFWYGADKAYKAYVYFAESTSVLIPSDVHYVKVVFEYPTYNNDICINLSDTSINGKYYPYIKRTQSLAIIGEGLKSAGTAHDEIRYNKATQKWEKVQRIGSVDLGTLNLYYISDNGGYFYGKLNGAKVPSLWAEVGNILAAQYNATNANSIVATGATPFNMSMGIAPNGNIYFVNTSYTDAASFKAAMAGVILYYELAEPIVTEIEEKDFNLDYLVWNGGTEEALASKPSSALRAEITYGFNAVGKIKEIDDKVTELSLQVGKVSEDVANKVDATYVDNAINAAIGNVINGDY